MDTITIAKKVWQYLNSWPDKPARFGLDNLEKLPVSIMLQQLPGAVVKQRFVNGTFIGLWPFAVYVRIQTEETAQRFSAVSLLNGLHAWMQANPLPDLGPGRACQRMEMILLPSVAADYNNGVVDYQAQYVMEYKEEYNDD